MDFVVLALRLLLAAVFGVAGLAKLADPAGFRRTLKDFGLFPIMIPWFGTLVSSAELAIALALLPAGTAWWAACTASTLLVLFALGISLALVRGNRPNCHCFGNFSSAPIGWPTLARNVALAAAAAFVVWEGRDTVGADGLEVVADVMGTKPLWLFMGVCVLALLATEGWLLIHLLRQNGRLLLRF
jgi:hypothetical protein